MHIAFFELEGWEKEIILSNFPTDKVFFSDKKLDELNLSEEKDFEIISVFVDSRVTKPILDHFPNLRFITTRSTGFDHIDLGACRERDISVGYVPGYGDNTVAEFAFGLILNLTRKMYQGIDQVKETGSFSLTGLRGTDLKDKTIGIVGVGRIGKEMVKIAKGFGMNIVAFDPLPDLAFSKEHEFEYQTLEDVLAHSNIISLHCPLNEKTTHLINRDNITLVKRGAYLVNTARGGIVETEALISALREGLLAGAAMDVLEEEGEIKDELVFLSKAHPREEELRTLLENHILMKMPNVLITPHTAFNSQEALERILKTTIDNIKEFLSKGPVNLVPQ